MRAKAAGYTTVSLPGAAVWHVSWIDKDDLVGWQAYFHARNRFIYALLHSPYDFGGGLVGELDQAGPQAQHVDAVLHRCRAGLRP